MILSFDTNQYKALIDSAPDWLWLKFVCGIIFLYAIFFFAFKWIVNKMIKWLDKDSQRIDGERR